MFQVKTIVIPAAGCGRRFDALCKEMPKPMLEIWGKPILEHILNEIRQSGIINNVILIVGYKKEKIIDYFGDGKNFGLYIEYAVQKEPRGTAQALYFCRKLISEPLFFLQWADILVPSTWYKKMLSEKPSLGAGVITVDGFGDWKTGAGVIVDKNWRVLDIVEKPEAGRFQWSNSGVFLLTQRVFDFLPKKFPEDREIHLAEALRKMGKLRAMPIPKNYCYDLKNREIYERLSNSPRPKFL